MAIATDPPSSLTERTVRSLQRMLAAGELGEPLPPERQLAALLNVSRITLRRALARLEDDRVIRREQGRGTYVSDGPALLHPDQLLRQSGPVLAVLVRQQGPWFNPQLTPWTWRICCALSPLLSSAGAELCLVNDEQFLAAALRGRLTKKRMTGFIAPTHTWEAHEYESAAQCGIPWVGLGRTVQSMFWNILDPDWSGALRDAIRDLKPTARDRVFIPNVPHPREVDQQCWLETAMAEFDRHRVPQSRIVVNSQGPYESQGYLATRWYLREFGEPTLVLSTFDMSIVGAYRALQAHGKNGLKGVRFLGAADLEICRCVSPRLSTLSLDYPRVARRIFDMLQTQRRTGNPVPLHREPAGYIRRESSEPTRE